MLKIYIYWHKCWCHRCGTGQQVKIVLLSFWSVNRWVSQFLGREGRRRFKGGGAFQWGVLIKCNLADSSPQSWLKVCRLIIHLSGFIILIFILETRESKWKYLGRVPRWWTANTDFVTNISYQDSPRPTQDPTCCSFIGDTKCWAKLNLPG